MGRFLAKMLEIDPAKRKLSVETFALVSVSLNQAPIIKQYFQNMILKEQV